MLSAGRRNTFSTNFFEIVLLSGGILPFANYPLYSTVFSCAYSGIVGFVVMGNVVGILNETNLYLRIVTLLHTIGFSMGLVLYWCIRLYRLTITRFIDEWFHSHDLDAEMVLSTEKRFKKTSTVFILIYWMFHFNFVASTFLNAFFIGGITDPKSYMLPTLYKCLVEPKNSTYWISSLCWDIDNFGKYIMVNSFVSAVYLTLIVPYGTTFLFYLFVIIYMNVNLDILTRKMNLFSKELPSFVEWSHKESLPMYRGEGLVDCNSEVSLRVHYFRLLRSIDGYKRLRR